MELKVDTIQELAPIKFNYEELKKELLEKSKYYKTVVYTQETISTAKQDRANLNKLLKAVNDEKIRIKNEIMKPYMPFEMQVKELMEIVQEAVGNIDGQVKSFEQKQKDEKKTAIEQYFHTNIGLYEGLIEFETIFNERWLNATYDIDDVLKEINHIFAKAKNDLLTIDSIIKNEDTNKQVQDFYFKNINDPSVLGNSLAEGKRIEETKIKLQQIKKQEEEKKIVKQTIIPAGQNQKQENDTQKEKLYKLCFNVFVTAEQANQLKQFFVNNNIRYERI